MLDMIFYGVKSIRIDEQNFLLISNFFSEILTSKGGCYSLKYTPFKRLTKVRNQFPLCFLQGVPRNMTVARRIESRF